MKQGMVRIIAGKWRGRKLKILDVKDLRPTPDRVRETLFNWLAPILPGARCLDLFSGSGVLGFESLSRGASYVEMVDQSTEVVDLINEEIKLFAAENAKVYRAKVPEQLPRVEQAFDVIFLDPPYQENLIIPTCQYLENHHYLADEAYIYLEAQQRIEDNALPEDWKIIKSQQAGAVFYHLAFRKKS